MLLTVSYFNELEDVTTDVIVERNVMSDYDFVPYGEGYVKNTYTETEVYIHGDLPQEIIEDMMRKCKEDKRYYSGKTKNWEWEAKG
jgi:hypothetical protein